MCNGPTGPGDSSNPATRTSWERVISSKRVVHAAHRLGEAEGRARVGWAVLVAQLSLTDGWLLRCVFDLDPASCLDSYPSHSPIPSFSFPRPVRPPNLPTALCEALYSSFARLPLAAPSSTDCCSLLSCVASTLSTHAHAGPATALHFQPSLFLGHAFQQVSFPTTISLYIMTSDRNPTPK